MDTTSSAHGAGSAASSSSSQSSNRWKYEVFLSFRGDDTRTTFTDHLFIALRNAGIKTFIDNQLTRGENIQSELDQEIEGSRIAVIIFSKRYAESRWCLRELSKIMRCLKDQEGKIVCPIFYDVDPSQVRKQKDSFGEAFLKHEDPNEVKQWREDLKASADLGGWNLKTTADGREGVFIKKIVGDVKGLLKTTDFKEAKHSVGMTFRVRKFSTNYLDVGGSPNVQIIGIWGMGGIGKSTLAKAVCSNYQHSFSRQCYLEDVRSKKKEMVSLQEQLLRDILKQPDIKVSSVAEGTEEIKKRLGSMKVLVVVDDIDDADQLDELAIEHESFGPGSRIIITTRDEQVLNIQKVDKKYMAQAMTEKEALELLSWHAFGNPCPNEEYIELARDVVDYCGRLPLALKVVGRLLATKKSKTMWQNTLDKLRNIPDGKIHETLKLSYDGLRDDHVKGVFLDISCFFDGVSISDVTTILDGSSRFSVEAEITTLCDRCLLYIDEATNLRMHDLIRDMGREIVRAESPVELGKRSRLWHSKDAKSVLRNKSGTEAVEGLRLLLPEHSDDEQSFSTKAFKNMRRLKFLALKHVKLTGSYKHLSKELSSLLWIGFPFEAIPADFDPRNLVYLGLWDSKLVRIWEDSNLTLLTIIEGREGTEFSNGNVLIFPQMIKYRGLKESDVDNFIDDVLVNDKPWASGVQEPLTSPHVFICAHMSQNEWNRYRARVLIDKFKEEAELRGLTDQVFVTACSHIGGHKYAGKLMIYSPDSDGSMTCHWYPFVTPFDVAKSLDKHIGKRKITERLWRFVRFWFCLLPLDENFTGRKLVLSYFSIDGYV